MGTGTRSWLAALMALAIAPAFIAAQATNATPGWTVPRTADGQPDFEGMWANNGVTPLERPPQWAGKTRLTDAELADFKARVATVLDGGDAVFFDDLVTAALSGNAHFRSFDNQTGNYDQSWLVDRYFDHRTSLIIDPADGRIPPLTPDARARNAERAEERRRHPADTPQDLSLTTRCITFGLPNLFAGYNSNYEFVQSRDTVVIRTEAIHDARVIPLDGRAHLGPAITQWNGDSRGHWDGDTLVVDTTNFSPATNFRGASDHLHLIERFRRTDADTLEYTVTIDDPTTWTRPWTLMIPLRRSPGEILEYACHEGNLGLRDILSGARAEERRRGSS